MRDYMSDDAFMKWCDSWKPCKRCECLFFGPVCPCERSGVIRPQRIYVSATVTKITT